MQNMVKSQIPFFKIEKVRGLSYLQSYLQKSLQKYMNQTNMYKNTIQRYLCIS